MERLSPQLKVRHSDGREGITVPDLAGFMAVCTEDETPVIWALEPSHSVGTKTELLSVIGPEAAKPVPEKCGAGRGIECCKFLLCGPDGFECGRFGSLRYTLMFREMNAQREPTEPFPDCMYFEAKEAAQ